MFRERKESEPVAFGRFPLKRFLPPRSTAPFFSSTGRGGVKGAPLLLRRCSRHFVMAPPPLTPPLLPGARSARKPSTDKEADVEETIGYQALIPSDEWDLLVEWDETTKVEVAS